MLQQLGLSLLSGKQFLRAFPAPPHPHAKPTSAKAHRSKGARRSALAAKEDGKMGNRMVLIETRRDPLFEDGFMVALSKTGRLLADGRETDIGWVPFRVCPNILSHAGQSVMSPPSFMSGWRGPILGCSTAM